MLSRVQVQHIAKLARIKLLPDEIESYQKDLSKILDFVDKLKEADIGNTEPYTPALGVFNVMREDSPRPFDDNELGQKLVEMAPAKEGKYVKVRSVFHQNQRVLNGR